MIYIHVETEGTSAEATQGGDIEITNAENPIRDTITGRVETDMDANGDYMNTGEEGTNSEAAQGEAVQIL